MLSRRRLLITTAIGGIVSGLLVGPTPLTFADTPLDAYTAIQAVSAAAETASEALLENSVPVADGTQIDDPSFSGGGRIDFSDEPSGGVELSSSRNQLTISLPYAAAASAGEELDSGILSYDNNNGSTTVPIAKSDGSLQIATVISNGSAPTRYSYSLAGDVQVVTQNEDGSLTLSRSDGSLVGVVASAWAKDGSDNDVPTRYEVTGTTITQVVDFTSSTVFPIVADPWFGVDLIKSFKWYSANGKPAISVAVTPMMGVVDSSVAAVFGWSELKTKVKADSKSRFEELTSKATYNDQWNCHAAGKAVIGIAGWLGIDKRPTWDLEGFRRPAGRPTDYIRDHCNW